MKKKLVTYLLLFCVLSGAAYLIRQEIRKPDRSPSVIPYMGHIQVLNACAIDGAAEAVGAFLRSKGFDVVEIANNDEAYFKETLIACRNGNLLLCRQLADSLKTDRLLLLRKEGVLLDATVFVGKDYRTLIKGS